MNTDFHLMDEYESDPELLADNSAAKSISDVGVKCVVVKDEIDFEPTKAQ